MLRCVCVLKGPLGTEAAAGDEEARLEGARAPGPCAATADFRVRSWKVAFWIHMVMHVATRHSPELR